MTMKTYCGNLLWQSGLTLLAPGGDPYVEFISAVKGGPKVGSDFAYAGAMTQCSLLGVAALFDPGRELRFDAAAKRFENSSAANARLAQPRVEA